MINNNSQEDKIISAFREKVKEYDKIEPGFLQAWNEKDYDKAQKEFAELEKVFSGIDSLVESHSSDSLDWYSVEQWHTFMGAQMKEWQGKLEERTGKKEL